jgi:hypothetical protein
MDTAIQIKEAFSLVPNFWFWIVVGLFTVLIRIILTLFKALAINNGEVDEPDLKDGIKWKNAGLKKIFLYSFFSNAKDIKIDDYWLPAIIGYSELAIFPLFMAKGWFPAIGAWIAIKTASSWGGWQKTRTAYNRFLLGNILSLSASFVIYSFFIKA